MSAADSSVFPSVHAESVQRFCRLVDSGDEVLSACSPAEATALLATDESVLFSRLVALRLALPASVNLSRLLRKKPALLLSSTCAEAAEVAIPLLTEALGTRVDLLPALLLSSPTLLLEPQSLEIALQQLKRLVPSITTSRALDVLADGGETMSLLQTPSGRKPINDEYYT